MSTTGKPYTIWEIGCLNEQTVSLFLFGNAYQKTCNEEIGTVFALFNCSARKNPKSVIVSKILATSFCARICVQISTL